MRPREVEQGKGMLKSMVKDLSDRFPGMTKSDSAQSHPTTTSQPMPAPPPVQLSQANLQQQQQQLNKMHQRSSSRSSHAPAAPTSSQPPFQFGAGSPAPDGVPTYIGKPPVTREGLQPAKKKQKHETKPAQAAPGSHTSPNVTKAISPEVKKQPAETKQQPKPTFCCSDSDCDRHNVGFESEEALRVHTQEHTIENPMQYVLQSLGSTLGLDHQEHAKKPVVSHDTTEAPTAAKMSVNGSKQGQTPNMKGENTPAAATPMSCQASMNRQGSAAGARPGAASKSTPSKDVAKTPASQKDASQQQPSHPPKEVVVEDLWANATIDPHDLFQAFQPFESGAGGAISDMNVYRSITPNDTPESSKDGVSEPNSDISDGVGLDISLDMNSFNFTTDGLGNMEDLKMFDEEQPALYFGSWEDMVDPSAFDKPFVFDASLYSMNAD
jgi:hypothetical protein